MNNMKQQNHGLLIIDKTSLRSLIWCLRWIRIESEFWL